MLSVPSIFDNNDLLYEILKQSTFKAVLNILTIFKPRKIIYRLLPEILDNNKNRYEFIDGLIMLNELLLAKAVIDIVKPDCYPKFEYKNIENESYCYYDNASISDNNIYLLLIDDHELNVIYPLMPTDFDWGMLEYMICNNSIYYTPLLQDAIKTNNISLLLVFEICKDKMNKHLVPKMNRILQLYRRMVRFDIFDDTYHDYQEMILPERIPDELYFDN